MHNASTNGWYNKTIHLSGRYSKGQSANQSQPVVDKQLERRSWLSLRFRIKIYENDDEGLTGAGRVSESTYMYIHVSPANKKLVHYEQFMI